MTSHGMGWKPGLPDIRDWRQTFKAVRLPASVDLRSTGNLPSVWDQGQIGSCVSHGVDAAYAFDLANHAGSKWDGSRLFIYWNGRVIEGTTGYDSGLTIADGIKALNANGSPPAADWPYVEAQLTTKPPQKAFDDGKLHEAVKYARVAQTVADMQGCLAGGVPFVIGFTVYDSFESSAVANTGDVPMPTSREQVLGGHCMLCVGYTTRNGKPVWIMRNSWSSSWGDGGYCYMPQGYLTSKSLASDFWTVQSVSSPDPSPVPPQPAPDPTPVPPTQDCCGAITKIKAILKDF